MRVNVLIWSPWLRTGRAIAVVRFLLVVAFLISFWIDPSQPARRVDVADSAVAIYFVASGALLAIAWTSWRLDTLLALPALLLDSSVFLGGLYFTESQDSTFVSPYMASFVFLVVSALLRWGQRRALLVLVVLSALYLLDCQALQLAGVDVDLLRMSRRLAYMVLLALAFVWIAPGPGVIPRPDFLPPSDSRTPDALLRAALDHAMAVTHARGGAVVWREVEGASRQLIERAEGFEASADPGSAAAELFGGPAPAPGAVLWSARSGAALRLSAAGTPVAARGPCPRPLLDRARGNDAIIVPALSSSIEARFVLWGISGICGDDLRLADGVRHDIESVLDRNHIAELQERALASQLRNALARDLHDGVAQSLAGALLRLEGLRNALRSGRDPFGNLDDAKAALRAEQANVREMIEQLKEPESLPAQAHRLDGLRNWLETAANGWGVTLDFLASCPDIRLNALVGFELRQLLREAIANAARHGGCGRVRIEADCRSDRDLVFTVEDDGGGIAPGAHPRSIAARLAALGGQLDIGTGPLGGALLRFSIPGAIEP